MKALIACILARCSNEAQAPSWAFVTKCSLIFENFGLWTNTGVGTVKKRKCGETEVFKDGNCNDSLEYYLILL